MIVGPLFIAAGLLWVAQLHVGSTYWLGILPAAILMPLGIGMTMMPTIAAATSGVPSHEAGLASGLISTSQQMGGALGLSILSGVAASVATNSQHLGPQQAALHGYHAAFFVATGFVLLAATVAGLVIQSPRAKKEETEAHAVRHLQTASH
jgi:MFS family permease